MDITLDNFLSSHPYAVRLRSLPQKQAHPNGSLWKGAGGAIHK